MLIPVVGNVIKCVRALLGMDVRAFSCNARLWRLMNDNNRGKDLIHVLKTIKGTNESSRVMTKAQVQ